ncbi:MULTISPECIES: penicillin-binding protein 2 [unclassified Novosphingobium]|uniref:penicillin-binding protein 2 n=1 Tax=unclassified Novosphingobium TaxID=2644732 RepID=UPI0025E83F27|nr:MULTISPECIES: penicillin-binding protein 2 [unclassified Novosphingobium]HQV02810.1 penicillin-binding protein 2 [Novosphingobium sp.]
MLGESSHVSSGTLKNSFERRSFLIGGLQTAVGVLLAARIGWIALVQNEKYTTASESNRVNLTLIPPRRGAILDRRGAQLASNRVEFRIDIIPERLVDKDRTVATLGSLLGFDPVQIQDLQDKLDKAHGYQPIEVISGLESKDFDKVLVRLPEMTGVVAHQGFTRWYPTGPSVAHLVGYVGPATAKEYEKERNPLLVTPGFKIGKDGLEKYYEGLLRGQPGAQRVEVTASGKFVRDLERRDDVPGKSIRLTIDGPLQDYASRRIGLESAAVVVIDCLTGEIVALTSMPAFDPNGFAGGIGRLQWKMLNEDDHIPLLNKAVRGLYPPGSTMKPMATLALQLHGVDPDERVGCPGGYRLGSRYFRCDAVHGSVDMRQAIEHSCNTYFWSMAHRVGYDAIAPVAKMLGLGQEFDLPGTNQRYGTIPDAAWKMRRYKQEWSAADSLNASIGQGYVSVSPLQLAVMTARIASGKNLTPSLLFGKKLPPGPDLPFTPEMLQVTHDGMFDVVNGSGTGTGSRIDIGGIKMAGKTGTAQVKALVTRGHFGDWKGRDHALFVCYAPADAPRYAMSVVVEHGTFGARAAAPIAKDVMTFLFDPATALERLHQLESSWGGTPAERMASKYRSFVSQYGTSAPKVGDDEAVKNAIKKADEAQAPIETPSNAPATTRAEEPAEVANAAPPSPAQTPSSVPSQAPQP